MNFRANRRLIAKLGAIHESTHMRTASNTRDDGTVRRGIAVSILAMHWDNGVLRITHRFTRTDNDNASSGRGVIGRS